MSLFRALIVDRDALQVAVAEHGGSVDTDPDLGPAGGDLDVERLPARRRVDAVDERRVDHARHPSQICPTNRLRVV